MIFDRWLYSYSNGRGVCPINAATYKRSSESHTRLLLNSESAVCASFEGHTDRHPRVKVFPIHHLSNQAMQVRGLPSCRWPTFPLINRVIVSTNTSVFGASSDLFRRLNHGHIFVICNNVFANYNKVTEDLRAPPPSALHTRIMPLTLWNSAHNSNGQLH